jgi:hypothetical protein
MGLICLFAVMLGYHNPSQANVISIVAKTNEALEVLQTKEFSEQA